MKVFIKPSRTFILRCVANHKKQSGLPPDSYSYDKHDFPISKAWLIKSLSEKFGHALTPGHGKAIVGAYLIGAHSSALHAVYPGLTVAITHTLSVFILGLVALFASQYILPEDLYPYLSTVSGLIVIALGVGMVWQRVHHSHSHHSHHDHDHNHSHSHPHSHHIQSGGYSHLPPDANGHPVTWKSLLSLGISGGLLPYPSALVLRLTDVSLKRPELGHGDFLLDGTGRCSHLCRTVVC